MRPPAVLIARAALLLLAASCSNVTRIPTTLGPATDAPAALVLAEAVEIELETGYSRTLRPATTWRLHGRIPEGAVYRSADQVLTVEGRDVQEAYLVVVDGALVGFYLPVERAFSPLAEPRPLPLRGAAAEEGPP